MFQRCMCLCNHFLFRHMFSYWSQPIYQIYLYAETFKYHMVITWSICPVAKLPYGTSVLYPGVIWPARYICGVSGTQYFFSCGDILWLLLPGGAICKSSSPYCRLHNGLWVTSSGHIITGSPFGNMFLSMLAVVCCSSDGLKGGLVLVMVVVLMKVVPRLPLSCITMNMSHITMAMWEYIVM